MLNCLLGMALSRWEKALWNWEDFLAIAAIFHHLLGNLSIVLVTNLVRRVTV
jgi:hypothetical protein